MTSTSFPDSGSPLRRIHNLMDEYPRQFWVLVLGTFIDRLGGALLFPFFSLYITRKFQVGMTEVGVLFAIFSVTSFISSFFGGALTDRMGRKGILLFGLVMSAISNLILGFVESLQIFILVVVVVGLLADLGFPAQQAMVADLLPEEKRTQGFGILRVTANLSVTLGPMIGGLLAAQSFLLLFICDAIASLVTAGLLFIALKETRAPRPTGEPPEPMKATLRGYGTVLRDHAFTWFLLASMLMVLVYMQMNTTLSVYLRDSHGVSARAFGYILSLNAAMVVLFQFPITRWIGRYRPIAIMVAGTLLYAVGFGLYGFTSVYTLFLLAMAIITVGEMLVTPVSQAIVARLAPEEMRGRYMAAYGFSWILPSTFGPLLAGLVMDNLDPRWVWYAAGLIGLLSAVAFYLLDLQVSSSRWAAVEARLDILERLETGQITAVEATHQLESIHEGRWAKLIPKAQQSEQRRLRLRVSELATGTMKADLRLPVGLVNTILYTQGRLSADLEDVDEQKLRALIAQGSDQTGSGSVDADGRRLEISVD